MNFPGLTWRYKILNTKKIITKVNKNAIDNKIPLLNNSKKKLLRIKKDLKSNFPIFNLGKSIGSDG